LIPALILQHFVEETGKQLHQLFDLICGTSTGGLIALGAGVSRLDIRDMVKVYEDEKNSIFPSNQFGSIGRIGRALKHGDVLAPS